MKKTVPDSLKDPVAAIYESIGDQLRNLTWSQFEDLVQDFMREAGFLNVQKLTRGSQQGKDIIGTWDSRFCLGRRVKFRVQVKHKGNNGLLKKASVGDSITDFLSQTEDKVLLIVTNGQLANDLIDQIDRLIQQGHIVQALAGERLQRLLAAYAKTWTQYLGRLDGEREALHHEFAFRDWLECLAMQAEKEQATFSLSRYWTEPYTWFFYKPEGNTIERLWTTSGGDFRFSCHNPSGQIQPLGRIVLSVCEKEKLPPNAVINTTPKGWHELKTIRISLSEKLGDFVLNDKDSEHLGPHGCFSCLLVFDGIDPGIYHFRIRCEGFGGSQSVRESRMYTLVSLGKEYPKTKPLGVIDVFECWPISMPMIKTLLQLPQKQWDLYGSHTKHVTAMYEPNTDALVMSLSTCDDNGKRIILDRLDIHTPHDHIIRKKSLILSPGNMNDVIRALPAGMSPKDVNEHFARVFKEIMDMKSRYAEVTDPSEPRDIGHRAYEMTKHECDRKDVLAVLEKAHERTPQNAKLSASYGCLCYKLGYLGYAQFYIECAFCCAPYNPAIAALRHCLLRKLKRPAIETSAYMNSFNKQEDVADFKRIVEYIEHHDNFPVSCSEAELAPFEKDADYSDRQMHGRW